MKNLELFSVILISKFLILRAYNIMKKTRMDTVNIRHGLTRIYTVFLIHFSVSSVCSVAKKLCGKTSFC